MGNRTLTNCQSYFSIVFVYSLIQVDIMLTNFVGALDVAIKVVVIYDIFTSTSKIQNYNNYFNFTAAVGNFVKQVWYYLLGGIVPGFCRSDHI